MASGEVHTFVSRCTEESDMIDMRAHEAAREAMKEVCPHLKIGWTLSLHNMQPYVGERHGDAKAGESAQCGAAAD